MLFWVVDIPAYYVNRIPFEEGVKYFGYAKTAIVQNYKFMWVHAVIAMVVAEKVLVSMMSAPASKYFLCTASIA